MGEHQFDCERFDYRDLVDGLRCRSTEWLQARRGELVREQRRLRVEELAVTAVLDDRGALDDRVAADDGVSMRAVEETVATARALEALPEVAAAAYAGDLSGEQLTPLVELADAASDGEWAVRGPRCAPADLARLARTKTKPTPEEAHARRAARELQLWWRRDAGMLAFRGALPDLDGALFESVVNEMIDRMRPANGEQWASRAQRGADALVELCRRSTEIRDVEITDPMARRAPQVHLVVQVPLSGPAEVAGVPLPDTMVETLRANARVETVLVDDTGLPVASGTTRPTLSAKIVRAVLLRDGHCRWPGCTRRYGLQIHHLWPRSWGGTDDLANLCAVCVGGGTDHHPRLAPHGAFLLQGNPNQPDGLRLVHRDDLAQHADLTEPGRQTQRAQHSERAQAVENTHQARAGPTAA